jgi:vancomycin resistance protein YoaR
MRKLTRLFFVFGMASIIGLAGCSEKTAKEENLEKKVAELEKQIEKDKEQKAEEKKMEEERPVVVEVIDPNTKTVLKTFQPEELGYKANLEQYKQTLEGWARDLARGTDTSEGYDKRMTLDRIGANGQVIKGTPQSILEESELVEKIVAASESGGKVELPLYTTQSGYRPEDVPSLGEVVVASYTTYYNTGVPGRSKNIELSAQAINNVILGVGDRFSFNTTVGPSDAAHGYQPAEEAINGKLVMGIGGGICQTSSTLFNAVDKLGVNYIERHHHSVNVGYVPKGRDATVSYGGVDFQFQNTTGVPLILKAAASRGTLTVEVRTSRVNQTAMNKR